MSVWRAVWAVRGDETALLYVTALVPVRVSFAVDIVVGTGAWWFDTVIDAYFITDLVLNFRTAIWLPNGTLEVNPKEIRAQYFRGWFAVVRRMPRLPVARSIRYSSQHRQDLTDKVANRVGRPVHFCRTYFRVYPSSTSV